MNIQKEFHALTARLVEEAGGVVSSRFIDGSGHNCVVIRLGEIERRFHYPKTGRNRGTSIPNTRARLRRLLSEMKQSHDAR